MSYGPLACLALLLPLGAAACAGRAHASGVTSIEARIDGLTCPTCVPPLTKSLKRNYIASTVEVNDDKDTATVRFAGQETFSPAEFQAAVERVRMHVVEVRMQACGIVEESGGRKVLVAGASRFAVRSERALPVKQPICADGSVDARSEPAVFQVTAFSLQ